MTHKRIWGLLLLPILTATLAGCPFSPHQTTDQPPPPPTYLPQTSAANVLANLKQAYVDKNYDQYVKLFADEFIFEVSPKELGGPNPIPATWGLSVEKTIHQHMFSAETVETITLDFIQHPAVPDSTEYGRLLWKVRMDGIHMAVNTRQSDGTLFTYLVPNAQAQFYFKDDPARLIDGKPTWFIVRWKDEPIALARATQNPAL